MKKIVLLFIVALLAIDFGATLTSANIDFAKNEAYYEALCLGTTVKNNVATCKAFQDYLNKKAADSKKDLDRLRADINLIRKDITTYTQQISKYEEDIQSLERQITTLSNSIISMEKSIVEIEANIIQLEANVEARNNTIKERMLALQGFINVNGYIEIIMGSSSMADLVRRLEGIKDITDSDKNIILEIKAELEVIENEKLELNRQKQALLDNRENIRINQETLEGIKEQIAIIVVEYQKQEATLVSKEREAVEDLTEYNKQIKAIGESLKSVAASAGWVRPMDSGFRISAGAWYYPSGGVHIGVDFATPVGRPIRAVGNGYILFSSNSCPTYGYLGNNCGAPGVNRGGNQVYLITNIAGKSYLIIYMHLERGSPIQAGKIVNQGDIIGRNGSSGSSTGPHLHIEVIYIGNNDVSYYATRWNGSLSYGAGFGTSAMNTRCSVNGNRAPCRLNPLDVFKVRYGVSY
ncbi:MAG: peptidoglycan DD-metalloendopeptidase family protein [Erysipelothrix sp.]|nr:peptidoglycan DD-metalloendopeptidase family protein [Erysipelothrix sp.]